MKKLVAFALVLPLLAPSMVQARGIFDLCRFVVCARFWDPPEWCDGFAPGGGDPYDGTEIVVSIRREPGGDWIVVLPDEEPSDEWSVVPDAEDGDEWAE